MLIVAIGSIDEKLMARILEAAARYDVSVEVTGMISEAKKWHELKRASLVLFPSFFEGFGLPPVEAQYAGTPCIAFDLPVLREVSGDGITFVARGDVSAMREEMSRILGQKAGTASLKRDIDAKVNFDVYLARVDNLLFRTCEKSRRADAVTGYRYPVPEPVDQLIRTGGGIGIHNAIPLNASRNSMGLQALRQARAMAVPRFKKPLVVYYPCFTSADAFSDHFHRASWYLPIESGIVERVVMGSSNRIQPRSRPDYMCAPRQDVFIDQVSDGFAFAEALAFARVILLWQTPSAAELAVLRKLTGATLLNVDTIDPAAAEYGRYCEVHWKCMSQSARNALLDKSRDRFSELRESAVHKGYRSAVVFCTGPSVERAFEFDFSQCFTHVCNTIVGNPALMDHINPDLISAGDVVSHFGISLYAERFREDLVRQLKARNCFFLTTAQFGNLLRIQYPEIEERILLCEQTISRPNFDLLSKWALPCLDSVLNIHMLPAAATICNEIYILGADGRDPDSEKNEDFWAHSAGAHYHELVETGHRAHPTFAGNREDKTFDGFLEAIRVTVETGERDFDKHYYALTPSHTPVLRERYVTGSQIPAQSGIRLIN